MNLFNLVATLVLNKQAYEQGLNEAGKSASSFSSKAGVAFKAVSKSVIATIGVITGLAAGLAKISLSTITYGDDVDKMSQKLGLSTDAFQKWSFAMQLAGSDVSTLQMAVRQLTDFTLKLAEGDAEALLALQELGIGYEGFMAMDNDEQLMTIVEALQGMENQTDKTAIAQQIFGNRVYQELMPVLNQEKGSLEELFDRFEYLGIVMTEDQAKASADLMDKWTLVQAKAKALTNNLLFELYPALDSIMDGFLMLGTNSEAGFDKIQEGLQGLLSELITKLPDIINVGSDILFGLLDVITETIADEDFVDNLVTTFVKIIDKLIENLPKTILALNRFVVELLKSILKVNWKEHLTTLFNNIIDIAISITPGTFKCLIDEIIDTVSNGLIEGFTNNNTLSDIISSLFGGVWDGRVGGVGGGISGGGRRASGGMLFGGTGTTYMVGEAGAEIVAEGKYGTGVTNVAQIQEAMYNALAQIVPVLVNGIVSGMNINAVGGTNNIVVKIGEQEFKSYIVKASNENLNQKGRKTLNNVTRYGY